MNPLPLVVHRIEEVRRLVREARREGRTIGFVPTMGALHAGHARLIETCRAESGYVVVSIYVNPAQFGPREDFARYPRNLDADRAVCGAAGTDLIFAPDDAEMYPDGEPGTYVEVSGLTSVLEGVARPTHFRGVTTVVTKLFQIVQPDLAVFGEKDFQQLQVVRRMVRDLDIPVTIRAVETVREPDGLAMSSRNRYLDTSQRAAALVLVRALTRARQAVADGERSADRVRQILRETIESEPWARLDYAEVVDGTTLRPVRELIAGGAVRAVLAAWIDSTRLIDNAELSVSEAPDE